MGLSAAGDDRRLKPAGYDAAAFGARQVKTPAWSAGVFLLLFFFAPLRLGVKAVYTCRKRFSLRRAALPWRSRM